MARTYILSSFGAPNENFFDETNSLCFICCQSLKVERRNYISFPISTPWSQQTRKFWMELTGSLSKDVPFSMWDKIIKILFLKCCKLAFSLFLSLRLNPKWCKMKGFHSKPEAFQPFFFFFLPLLVRVLSFLSGSHSILPFYNPCHKIKFNARQKKTITKRRYSWMVPNIQIESTSSSNLEMVILIKNVEARFRFENYCNSNHSHPT